MKSTELWHHIHTERANLIDTWIGFTSEQWQFPSLCAGWSVQDVAGHVVAGAEQTPVSFVRSLAQAGFKFDTFTDREAKKNSAAGPTELVRRLQARTTTTNHPPGPADAMLGEIVVHGADIRRPLHVNYRYPEAALVHVADNWKNANLIIGAKRRIAGVKLTATDASWTHGDGPEVAGPMIALVLAMAGREDAQRDLSGEGVATLASRN
ncbi:MAG TPA: maleylpyruvate isomerase family mycothiol-dependent enzyme [Acidimicrobiales bacterium]|nr:maleylpyruvate isomerase family mycothiol-dependent enzyme [Acidimicrobiales bacterium]